MSYDKHEVSKASSQGFFSEGSTEKLPGYHPDWLDNAMIELFNPEIKSGTYYCIDDKDDGYKLYCQIRNEAFDYGKTLWVNCYHFRRERENKIVVTKQDELRLIYETHDGCSYSFDRYSDIGRTFSVGTSEHLQQRQFSSLADWLQDLASQGHFTTPLVLSERIPVVGRAPGSDVDIQYTPIDSVCEQYERELGNCRVPSPI